MISAIEANANDKKPCETNLYRASLTEDFETRDRLPQTEVCRDEWHLCGRWGPAAAAYPQVSVPDGVDSVTWRRDRVIEVAKRYLGRAYAKSHIPDNGGFDCSNFTSWIYNFGLGVKFSSNIKIQAEVAGRKLESHEPLMPGDLIFLRSIGEDVIHHVIVYVDNDHVIDSNNKQKAVYLHVGHEWYQSRIKQVRRIIE